MGLLSSFFPKQPGHFSVSVSVSGCKLGNNGTKFKASCSCEEQGPGTLHHGKNSPFQSDALPVFQATQVCYDSLQSWGQNPGSCACALNALPPSHAPSSSTQFWSQAPPSLSDHSQEGQRLATGNARLPIHREVFSLCRGSWLWPPTCGWASGRQALSVGTRAW